MEALKMIGSILLWLLPYVIMFWLNDFLNKKEKKEQYENKNENEKTNK